jgi:hypothetical protein
MTTPLTSLATLLLEPAPHVRKANLQQVKSRAGVRGEEESGRIAGIERQYGQATAKLVTRLLSAQGIDPRKDLWIGQIMIWLGRAASLHPDRAPKDWPSLDLVNRWAEATKAQLVTQDLDEVQLASLRWDSDVRRQVRDTLAIMGQNPDDPTVRARYTMGITWMTHRVTLGDVAPWPDLDLLQGCLSNKLGVDQATWNDLSNATCLRMTSLCPDAESDRNSWDEYCVRARKMTKEGWTPIRGKVVLDLTGGIVLERLDEPVQLQDESRITDHCVGKPGHISHFLTKIEQGRGAIYSLRHPCGLSLATFDIDLDPQGTWIGLTQAYGPKDKPIHPSWIFQALDVLARIQYGEYSENLMPNGWTPNDILAHIRMDDAKFNSRILANPGLAMEWAKIHGPSDETREVASRVPALAVKYAAEIDRSAHPVTRMGSTADPAQAFLYAKYFGADDLTRRAASTRHDTAFMYAENVDRAPHPDTFLGALQDRRSAASYMRLFPSVSVGTLRNTAVSHSPECACMVAMLLDKGPRDDTRAMASTDTAHALEYACCIEQAPHPVTVAGVVSSSIASTLYAIDLYEKLEQQHASALCTSALRTTNGAALWSEEIGPDQDTWSSVLENPLGMDEDPAGWQAIADIVEAHHEIWLWRRDAVLHFLSSRAACIAFYLSSTQAPEPTAEQLQQLGNELGKHSDDVQKSIITRMSERKLTLNTSIYLAFLVPACIHLLYAASPDKHTWQSNFKQALTSQARRSILARKDPEAALGISVVADGTLKHDVLDVALLDMSVFSTLAKKYNIRMSQIDPRWRIRLSTRNPLKTAGAGPDYVTRVLSAFGLKTCGYTFEKLTKIAAALAEAQLSAILDAIDARTGYTKEDIRRARNGSDYLKIEIIYKYGRAYERAQIEWLGFNYDGWFEQLRSKLAPLRMLSRDDSGRGEGASLVEFMPLSMGVLRVPDQEGYRIPVWSYTEKEDLPFTGGLDFTKVVEWYDELQPKQRAAVARRLGLTTKSPIKQTDVSALWLGATPIDAAIHYKSNLQLLIDVNQLPYLGAFKRVTRTDAGWVFLFPADTGIHSAAFVGISQTLPGEIEI